MNFRTIKDLNLLINKNLYRIPKDVDLIVGVPRSGMFVASLISLYLNLPLCDINSLLNNSIYESGTTKIKENWINDISNARKILIVEDSSISGKSLNIIKKQLLNYKYRDKVIILTIYVTNYTKKLTDLYFEICNPPRTFEWNYLHIQNIKNFCFDIDGVLCEDPTPEENDDGDKYKNFVLNTPVRVVPTFTIGAIVTSRLEKYRKETEIWLKNNNIKYDKLVMMNVATKDERVKLGNHGQFKGEVFKKLKDCNLFVESDYNQAVEIAKISGKTVFCVDTQEVVYPNSTLIIKNTIKRKIKRLLKRLKIKK